MAITAAFQAEDRGSTPRTRSNHPLIHVMCIYTPLLDQLNQNVRFSGYK